MAIKKWSDDKLGFKSVTNNDLVCKGCVYSNRDGPAGKCKKFAVKPNKVLLGGECDERKTEK